MTTKHRKEQSEPKDKRLNPLAFCFYAAAVIGLHVIVVPLLGIGCALLSRIAKSPTDSSDDSSKPSCDGLAPATLDKSTLEGLYSRIEKMRLRGGNEEK